jgi:phosphoribosyl 1,2-cyclic phosphodiesterase
MPRLVTKFWGVRGSLPTPGPENLEYGGNTACVEVRNGPGGSLILDAGTGVRNLGVDLVQRSNGDRVEVGVLLSHYHWDHIQGLPFFAPLYSPKYHVTFFGPNGTGTPKRLLTGQMQEPYFPIRLDLTGSAKDFVTAGHKSLSFGNFMIQPFPLTHPQGATAYRIECGEKVIVYASDREHGDKRLDILLRDHAQGADILIYDAQYTPEEYEAHVGWGHSTWLEATRVASECQVGKLVLFHHDPNHSDHFFESILKAARRHFPNTLAAKEGLEIVL